MKPQVGLTVASMVAALVLAAPGTAGEPGQRAAATGNVVVNEVTVRDVQVREARAPSSARPSTAIPRPFLPDAISRSNQSHFESPPDRNRGGHSRRPRAKHASGLIGYPIGFPVYPFIAQPAYTFYDPPSYTAPADWSAPRLICIAADFTKYDSHAVQQMDRNIDLIRYRHFGSDLLLLELVNAVATSSGPSGKGPKSHYQKKTEAGKSVTDWIAQLGPAGRAVFDALDHFLASLGDDVQRKDLKLYVAYKRLRNFATVVVTKKYQLLFLHLDPTTIKMEEGFIRDVREVGHWGTGDVEVTLNSLADLERAKPLILQAYEGGPDAG